MHHLKIREQFIDYFTHQGHTLVPPSPIIPQDDPTLLFTNAGMNQFKDVLLGKEKRSYNKALSVQPCMRVGGKHNDLDAVGRDGRHLTWFEMLGNWSFGDYGKEKAILYAWELVSKHLQLDTRRLYVSVYKDDDEAYNLWKKISGLPDSQMVRLGNIAAGDEENFWSMGPTGPCGRCTELYYDQGEEKFGHDVVGGETDRFLEFWNLVFMEFNRDESGATTPLKMLSVDTGMGMERIVALMEGHSNVFDTSLFMPLIQHLSDVTRRPQTGDDLVAMRVLADHSRALTFALADNGLFDRAGRGYVLRRILRRAVLHGTRLGFKEPFLYKLVAENLKNLPVYGVSSLTQAKVEAQIRGEEERFFETLDRGLHFFAEAANKAHGKTIQGDVAFQLHDTFGFPVDLTQILAEEQGLQVDMAGFEAALEQQRQRSQGAAQFYDKGGWVNLTAGEPVVLPTHDLTTKTTHVLRYRADDDGTLDLVLSDTPFYVEGGGELADHGILKNSVMTFNVHNVVKNNQGVVHQARLTQGQLDLLHKNNEFTAVVDLVRRKAKAAHHTATHLLHAALRQVLGDGVKQMGSLVDADRLRFDIAFNRALTADELIAVEDLVNHWITADHAVQHLPDMSMQQAQELGALAFFGDKYGEKVRVINIPGVSVELCGGNHVEMLGQIGSIAVLSDEALSAGVRRIEAIAQHAAVTRARDNRLLLKTLAQSLSVPVGQIQARIEKLQQDVKDARAAVQKAQKAAPVSFSIDSLQKDIQEINGKRVLVLELHEQGDDVITGLIDQVRAQRSDILVFALKLDGDAGTLFVGAGDAAVASGLKAGDLAREVGKRLGSGGGGKPGFARAGFKGHTAEQARAAIAAIL